MKKKPTMVIESSDLFAFILKLVLFPNSQICRHYVALDLLSLMESEGITLPTGLVNALSEGSNGDEDAEKILLQLLKV